MTIVNTDMAAAWDGDEGAGWARSWERYDAGVRDYHARLVDAAAFGAADRVLDIGCGNGLLTRDAARAAATATGVDLSSVMLARAAALAEAEGLHNATFLQADAQVHPFGAGAYDVAVSRFGSMFFADPVAAFRNIARALVPGARMVLLVWQGIAEQEWMRSVAGALAVGRDLPAPPPGAPGPLGLADPDRVRAVLGDAGFRQVAVDPCREAFHAGADADDALAFLLDTGMARGMLSALTDDDRATAVASLREVLSAHDTSDGVVFGSACWLVTARAGEQPG